MRLIDADALNGYILTAEVGKVYRFCFPCKEIQQAIDEQPTIEPLSAREAYIKGLADGIRECTEKLKKLKADMRGEGNGNE